VDSSFIFQDQRVRKVGRIALSLLVGVIGAEVLSSAILIGLGTPASLAFAPTSWLSRLIDPVTLVFGVSVFWLAFWLLRRLRPQPLPSIKATENSHPAQHKSVTDRDRRRA
jgi:hypothetical protein